MAGTGSEAGAGNDAAEGMAKEDASASAPAATDTDSDGTPAWAVLEQNAVSSE